jgi:hypothetical protein
VSACAQLAHPNVAGDGCPCGLVKLEPREPLPWPIPAEESVARMLREYEDWERDRRLIAWRATRAARSR